MAEENTITTPAESGRCDVPEEAFDSLFTEEAQADADKEFGPSGFDPEPGKGDVPDNPGKSDEDAGGGEEDDSTDPDKADEKKDGDSDEAADEEGAEDKDDTEDPEETDPEKVTFKVDGEDLTRAEIRELKKGGMRLEDYRAKTEEVADLRREAQGFRDLMNLVKADSSMLDDLQEWFDDLPEDKTKKLSGVMESIRKGKPFNAFKDDLDRITAERDEAQGKVKDFETEAKVQKGLKVWAKDKGVSNEVATAVYDYAGKLAEDGIQVDMDRALVLYKAENPTKSGGKDEKPAEEEKPAGDGGEGKPKQKKKRAPKPPRGSRVPTSFNTPATPDGSMSVPLAAFEQLMGG